MQFYAFHLMPWPYLPADAESLPDARLVVVPDAGDYPYLEQPEAFAEAVATFLRP